MRRCAGPVELITAFVSAVIGGLALTTPISLAWARGTSTLQMELLGHSMPRATALGCLTAVVVTVFASAADSGLVAWAAALCGVTVVLVNHLMGRSFSTTAPLTTLSYIDSLAGGVLLGGLCGAAMARPLLAAVFTLGTFTSLTLSELSVSRVDDGDLTPRLPIAWFIVDSPPLWLIWPVAGLIAVCMVLSMDRRGEPATSVELPLWPTLAALVTVLVMLTGSEWLVRRGSTVVDVALVAVATVIAATIVALLLPGRDGELIELAFGISAAGSAVVVLPLSGWMVPLLTIASAGGLLLGFRWSMPALGMAAIVALAVFAAVTAAPARSEPAVAIVGCLALAAISGYCFAAALPRHSPSLMLAIAILFVPGVVVVMRGRVLDGGPELPRRYAAPDIPHTATPGAAAVLITVGCALGLFVLRRRRPLDAET